MTEKTVTRTNRFLYLVLIIEGGALMAVELIGAKLIAPFYGNSLYVWASVLAITLGGLAIGYFLGGVVSRKFPSVKTLFAIIAASALLVLALPHTSNIIMSATLSMELRTGIVISCLIFLMPPMVCFGIVGPLVVRLVSTELDKVGKAAGTVYFTSTVGGIAATFLFGFYLIPFWGLKFSCYATGISLAVLPILYIIYSNSKFQGLKSYI